MRSYFFLVFWLIGFSVLAQNTVLPTGPFIRIYNAEGKKIGKGRVITVSDSVLTFGSDYRGSSLPIQNIHTIKTKHSKGHLPLVLGISGFVAGATIAGINYNEDAILFGRGFEMIGTGFIGALGTSSIGAIISGARKEEVFIVDGDIEKVNKMISELGINQSSNQKE